MCFVCAACTGIPSRQASIDQFILRQEKGARSLEAEGRLADALSMWLSMKPLGENAELEREVARLEGEIDAAVRTHLARGNQAYATGKTALGDAQMLSVLALQPAQKEALSALRASQSARVRAQQTGKQDSEALAAVPRPAPREEYLKQELQDLYFDQNYEAMIALETQADVISNPGVGKLFRKAYIGLADRSEKVGDTLEALHYLQAAMTSYSLENDPLLARSLELRAELSRHWYLKGSRLMVRDLDASVTALKKALEFNPYNEEAKVKYKQAAAMQRNLKKIETAK